MFGVLMGFCCVLSRVFQAAQNALYSQLLVSIVKTSSITSSARRNGGTTPVFFSVRIRLKKHRRRGGAAIALLTPHRSWPCMILIRVFPTRSFRSRVCTEGGPGRGRGRIPSRSCSGSREGGNGPGCSGGNSCRTCSTSSRTSCAGGGGGGAGGGTSTSIASAKEAAEEEGQEGGCNGCCTESRRQERSGTQRLTQPTPFSPCFCSPINDVSSGATRKQQPPSLLISATI